MFYLVNQRKKICFYFSRGFVCSLGKNLWSQIWWGTSKAFIWDQLHWSEMVLRCSRCKKWIKNGLKLDKKNFKNCNLKLYWHILDIFLMNIIEKQYKLSFETNYIDLWSFWWVLQAKNRSKRAEKSSKSVKNHPKLEISNHIHTRYGHNMASYGMFTHVPVTYYLHQPYPASYGLKWPSDSCK